MKPRGNLQEPAQILWFLDALLIAATMNRREADASRQLNDFAGDKLPSAAYELQNPSTVSLRPVAIPGTALRKLAGQTILHSLL